MCKPPQDPDLRCGCLVAVTSTPCMSLCADLVPHWSSTLVCLELVLRMVPGRGLEIVTINLPPSSAIARNKYSILRSRGKGHTLSQALTHGGITVHAWWHLPSKTFRHAMAILFQRMQLCSLLNDGMPIHSLPLAPCVFYKITPFPSSFLILHPHI